MKRPLFWAGLVFLSTTAAFLHLDAKNAALVCTASAVFSALFCGAFSKKAALVFAGCAAGSVLFLFLWFFVFCAWIAPVCGRPVTAAVAVSQVRTTGNFTLIFGRARLVAPDGRMRTVSASLASFSDLGARPGDTIYCAAESGEAPARLTDLSGKAAVRLTWTGPLAPPERPARSWWAAVLRMRLTLARRAANLAGGEAGGVLAAMLFGEQALMHPDALQAFRAAGLAHLVVVSGLHLTIFSQLIGALAAFFRLRRARLPLLLAACWGFALLCGLGPSVVRAAVMLTLVYTAQALERQSDGLSSLAAAGILIAIANPPVAASASFALSFLATAGILLLAGPIEGALVRAFPRLKENRPARAVFSVLAVTCAAQAGAAPAVVLLFGGVSLWSLPANLLAAGLILCLFPLGALGVALSSVFPALAPLFGAVCRPLLQILLAGARFFAALPPVGLDLTERYQIVWFAAFYLVLAVLLARRPGKRAAKHALLGLLASLLLCSGVFLFLRRESADVIRFAGGEYFAVQRGASAVLVGAPRSAAEAEDAAQTLSRLGVRRLEWILLLDSCGVDAPMLRLAQTFSCGRIAAPDESETRAFAYSSNLALTALKDGEFTVWDAVGVKIDSGAVTFSFDAGQALKSEGKCVIMGKTALLTPVGNADLRCRFAAKGQA